MGIWISGFLPDDSEDPFIKYEHDVNAKFNGELLTLLGHASLDELGIGMWPLTEDQVRQISKIIEQSLPLDLDIFITVLRD